mmetsp:Transcript_29135/g.78843  ORF Transcript_29135/g.78843 Transcript_29135/m.78843 type:complete len:233 (-) Transcript_29135:132-830(-)
MILLRFRFLLVPLPLPSDCCCSFCCRFISRCSSLMRSFSCFFRFFRSSFSALRSSFSAFSSSVLKNRPTMGTLEDSSSWILESSLSSESLPLKKDPKTESLLLSSHCEPFFFFLRSSSAVSLANQSKEFESRMFRVRDMVVVHVGTNAFTNPLIEFASSFPPIAGTITNRNCNNAIERVAARMNRSRGTLRDLLLAQEPHRCSEVPCVAAGLLPSGSLRDRLRSLRRRLLRR